jgi:hypothetical protein
MELPVECNAAIETLETERPFAGTVCKTSRTAARIRVGNNRGTVRHSRGIQNLYNVVGREKQGQYRRSEYTAGGLVVPSCSIALLAHSFSWETRNQQILCSM